MSAPERARAWPRSRLLPLSALGVASASIYALGLELFRGVPATRSLPVVYYPLFALYLAAAWGVWRRPGVPPALIVAFALAFRLLAMNGPPSLSSDAYRYAWDGRVQRSGSSPYRHAPADPALASLADHRIHPQINRPSARTVYPPGAEVLFALIPFDLDAVRLVMIGCDLLTILLLMRLLALLGLDPARAVVYAWAPLAVLEVGNNGHLEAAMLPLLVGAAVLHREGRHRRAGLLLGGAVSMKLYPALAAAGLWRPRPVALLAPAAGLVASLYLLYGWSVGTDVLGFLPQYVGVAEDHNIGARAAIEWAIGGLTRHPREVAFGICVLALVAGATLIARSDAPPERRLLHLTGLYLLTLPTAFHPWYALWLIPWLAIEPRASWLYLLAALPLSYLKYGAPGGVMPSWIVPAEILPTGALLLLEARRTWRPA